MGGCWFREFAPKRKNEWQVAKVPEKRKTREEEKKNYPERPEKGNHYGGKGGRRNRKGGEGELLGKHGENKGVLQTVKRFKGNSILKKKRVKGQI